MAIETLSNPPETAGWVLPESLRELSALDPELIAELIESFVSDTASRLECLRAAFEEGDFDRVRREAHGIKGSASQMGAGDLPRLCRLTEVAAACQSMDGVRECLDALERSFAGACREMQNYAGLVRGEGRGNGQARSAWS